MHKIEHNSLDSIARVVLSGTITTEEIEQLSIELHNIVTGKKIFLLTDARGVIYDLKTEDLNVLVDSIEQTNKDLSAENMVFEAIIINSPKESAFTILFNMRNKRFNHTYKIFSTESAAINWLMSEQK
jgi:hypothetical protein